MKTLKEEKAEYARRIEIREAYEQAKDTIDEIEIEAIEKGGTYIYLLESSNPSWNYNEYSYRIKIEPMEFWINIYTGLPCNVHYYSEKVAQREGLGLGTYVKTIKVREVIE